MKNYTSGKPEAVAVRIGVRVRGSGAVGLGPGAAGCCMNHDGCFVLKCAVVGSCSASVYGSCSGSVVGSWFSSWILVL